MDHVGQPTWAGIANSEAFEPGRTEQHRVPIATPSSVDADGDVNMDLSSEASQESPHACIFQGCEEEVKTFRDHNQWR